MIIKHLNIISFGALKDKEFDFSPNLNIIYGRNESGKSTISAFIEAMFYSFPPRDKDRVKHLPWDNSLASGSMDIEKNGEIFTIYRKFGLSPKNDAFTVTPPVSLENLIPKNRETYRKSVYTPENGASHFGITDEIEKKLSNMISSGDESVNASATIEILKKQKRALVKQIRENDEKITLFEKELNSSLACESNVLNIKQEIKNKEEILSLLLNKQKKLEENISKEVSFIELDEEIRLQKEYISHFPASFPDFPKTVSHSIPALIFSIICTIALFIIGFVHFLPILFFALLPIVFYGLVFALKKYKFNAEQKNALFKVGCSSQTEYEKLLQEKTDALKHLDFLVNKRNSTINSAALENSLLQKELASAYNKILSLKDEISHLKEKIASLTYRPCDEVRSDLECFITERADLANQPDAIDKAIEGMEYAKERISKDFIPSLNKKAMEYLKKIAPKDGRDIKLSSTLELLLTDPLPQDLASSSFGFKSEMYLCFRIALSECLYGSSFPLILDDPFLGSDDYRENKLIDLLNSVAEERQVIVFTNRKNDYFAQLNCKFIDITPSNDV